MNSNSPAFKNDIRGIINRISKNYIFYKRICIKAKIKLYFYPKIVKE